MKRKDIGLLVSICVLVFMAVFSEKRVEVTEGYFVTQAELKQGGKVFRRTCRSCHGRNSQSGAPSIGPGQAWERRLRRGMEALIDHALFCAGKKGRLSAEGGAPSLTREEAGAAVAYMVRQSGDLHDQPGQRN